MSHVRGVGLQNSGSFTLRFLISFWIDLVQWISSSIKVLHMRNSLDWPWGTSTIQLNLRCGTIKVHPFLPVVTLLIQLKWRECSSRISVVLCQSSSIPGAPRGLVQAKPCSSFERNVACCEHSRINLLVRKTGMFISFNNGLPHLILNIYSGWIQMAWKPY